MTDERIKILREEIKKGKKLNATYLTKSEREEIINDTVYLEVASQELSHFDKFKNSLISNMQKIQEEHDKEIWEYENCKLSSWFDELRYKINKISL